MVTEAEFEKFYQSKLIGDLYEFEARRKSITGKIRIILVSEVVVLAGICLYFFWLRPGNTDSFFFSGPARLFWIILSLVIFIIVFVFSTIGLSKKFRRDFKEIIIKQIIGFISKEISYVPADKIDISEFRNSGIFTGRIVRYDGRDLVKNNLGDISYRFSWLSVDTRTYRSTSLSSKTGSSTTKVENERIFEGIFYVADLGTRFPAEAVILSNFTDVLRWGIVGRFLQDSIMGKRIQFEDPDFENEFAVYGNDSAIISKMISPGLRKWIMDFRTKTKSMLYISFKGAILTIGAYLKKQMFEARIIRKVNDYDYILENFRYLVLFNGILEELGKKH